MDDMDVHASLAAHSLLTSLALALAARDVAQPTDALIEVVASMRSSVDAAKAVLPEAVSFEHVDTFVAVFNSELEHVQSMAQTLLRSMGVK